MADNQGGYLNGKITRRWARTIQRVLTCYAYDLAFPTIPLKKTYFILIVFELICLLPSNITPACSVYPLHPIHSLTRLIRNDIATAKMTSPRSSESSAWSPGAIPEPPKKPTLTDVDGFDALQASLSLLSRQRETPECDINTDSFRPAHKMRCQSIWYYFNDDELDEARDTITQEHYWCWEAAILLNSWIDKHATVDQMSELPNLWCPSAAGGWRAIAVSLRNKLLETGMSRVEIRRIRLLCKHQAYYQIELEHLEPMRHTLEHNYWLVRAQTEQSVLDSQTLQHGLSPISQEVEKAPVPETPPTPSTQPARRKRGEPRHQDQNAARSTVTTRAQSRKLAMSGQSGKEVNFLRERKSSDSNNNNNTTLGKTTASKTARRNSVGKSGIIGGKVDSRKTWRTGGTRKRGSK